MNLNDLKRMESSVIPTDRFVRVNRFIRRNSFIIDEPEQFYDDHVEILRYPSYQPKIAIPDPGNQWHLPDSYRRTGLRKRIARKAVEISQSSEKQIVRELPEIPVENVKTPVSDQHFFVFMGGLVSYGPEYPKDAAFDQAVDEVRAILGVS